MAQPIAWMGNGRPLPADKYPPTTPFAQHEGDSEALDDPANVPSLPALSSPPSYSTLDIAPQQRPTAVAALTRPSFPLTRGYEIRHALSSPGLSIRAANTHKSICYIGRYSAMDTPDLIFYAAHDSKGQIFGQVKLFAPSAPRNMEICLGERSTAWQAVTSVVEGKVFHSEAWYFTPTSNAANDAHSLCWKPTHDAHLGSGRFRSKDLKLVDADESVVAVYIDSTTSNDGTVGAVEWKVGGESEEAVLTSLIVLMAIRERARRRARQAGRAVVNQAHQFPAKGI